MGKRPKEEYTKGLEGAEPTPLAELYNRYSNEARQNRSPQSFDSTQDGE